MRTRLLWLAGGAVVPALAVTLWLFALERRDAIQRTEEQLVRLVDDATAQHEALLVLGGRVLQSAALMEDVSTGDRAACEHDLAALANATPEIVNPTRTNAAGVIDCVPGRTPGADVRDNPIFKRTLATDSVVVGPYARSTSIPEAVVPLNLRLTDRSGRPVGIVSIGVRMGWFDALVDRLDLPEGSVVSMVDGSGLVLARSPDAGLVGRRFPAAQMVHLLQAGERRGVVDGIGLDSVERRVAWARLRSPEHLPVSIAVAVPQASLAAEANRALAIRLGLIAAMVVMTALAVTAVLPRLILRDLARLDEAADRIGTGDFTVRTGVVDAPAELQTLADRIDEMAERLATREERQLQAQKLESVGRLAGGVAHDFNNMLTAVMGNVEYVRDSMPVGTDARTQLDATLDAVRRSGQLTRQLLTFARREAVSVTPMLLCEALEETAQLMRRTLGPDIAVAVDCAGDLRVGADRALLEQALVNLAFNARDAMPQGGNLTLRAHRVGARDVPREGAEGAWVRLDVQDTGVGMSPEVRRRVFEPFFTTKDVGKGSGLGLAMVYATMEQFGGAASVESALGHGTTVTLWFPAPDESAIVEPSSGGRSPWRDRPATTARILLVEDEPTVRAVAARALRRAGYDVTEAEDGVAGVAELDVPGAQFDIIVSDVRMPRMGGPEFGDIVRRRHPDMPLLFLSGFQGEDRVEPLLATPRTKLLPKPFRAKELMDTVAELIAAR